MKQQFTVSAISKLTGADRRTIDRALIDVEPVASKQSGARNSLLFDRDDVTAALAAAGVPRQQVVRLLPFGGSPSRLVGWNTLLVHVRLTQRALAIDREDWPDRFGVSTAQADRIASRTATLVMATADALLADFGERCADSAGIDEALLGSELAARDAAPGEFARALTLSDDAVRGMIEAALLAESKAASNPKSTPKESSR